MWATTLWELAVQCDEQWLQGQLGLKHLVEALVAHVVICQLQALVTAAFMLPVRPSSVVWPLVVPCMCNTFNSVHITLRFDDFDVGSRQGLSNYSATGLPFQGSTRGQQVSQPTPRISSSLSATERQQRPVAMAATQSAAPMPQDGDPQQGSSQQDVWLELFGTVRNLSETVELATQAFANEPGDKVRLAWNFQGKPAGTCMQLVDSMCFHAPCRRCQQRLGSGCWSERCMGCAKGEMAYRYRLPCKQTCL